MQTHGSGERSVDGLWTRIASLLGAYTPFAETRPPSISPKPIIAIFFTSVRYLIVKPKHIAERDPIHSRERRR